MSARETTTPESPRWAPPRVASEWWSRAAVLGTVLVAGLIVLLQLREADRTRQAFAGVRELREARLDLSKGFLHLTQAGAADAPYTREQGLALLRQAVRRMEKDFEPADAAEGREFERRVEEFRGRFEEWANEEARSPGAAAELRAAFYALEREAETMDAHLQGRLRELGERNRTEFIAVASVALVLLAGFCAAVIRVQRARVSAERQLRAREARFRGVAESLPQLVWTCTPDGRCDYLSRRWLDYTGVDEAAQLGEGWVERVHAEDRARLLRAWSAAVAEGAEFRTELRLLRHDGQARWFDLRAVCLRDDHGVVHQWLGAATDIQEERELRTAMEAERNFSATIIDSLPGVFYLYDTNGKFLRWNKNFERVTGCTAEEIARMHPLDFFQGEDKARVEERIREVFVKGQSHVEADFVAKEGTATPYYFTGMTTKLGEQTSLVGVGIDIAERKRAEQAVRAMNETLELRVAQRTAELQAKNRELETFTYSVSHDLKAPLRGIDGYSRLLLEDHAGQLDDEGRRFLDAVRKAAAQMAQLIDDLLAYSQLERRAITMTAVKPQRVFEALPITYADAMRDQGIKLTVNLPDVAVRAEANGLAQVLRNLVDNAVKFTRGVKDPEIEVAGRIEGAKTVLWVRDNGIGFDMKFAERIFDIFQRLHRAEDYPGTGIGLAIVRKAMERMGGRVWVEGAPGRGATFYLELQNHE